MYGVDHPNFASALNNRGVLSKELGDLESAKSDYDQALRILEVRYGPHDRAVAQLLNHQALILMAERKYEEALGKCLRALKIDEKSFGPDHEAVARDLATRGGILQ
ncbi:MAG: tetratricopeptide repeat protein [Deltaproteobacteria bacterium]|nr:tetratricopeptide repeat protein [Deltaproteobacteria bacterium]